MVPVGTLPPGWVDGDPLSWRIVGAAWRTTMTLATHAGTTLEPACRVESADGDSWVTYRAAQVLVAGYSQLAGERPTSDGGSQARVASSAS